MLHLAVSVLPTFIQKCDNCMELFLFSTNWWHVWRQLFLPLLVGLQLSHNLLISVMTMFLWKVARENHCCHCDCCWQVHCCSAEQPKFVKSRLVANASSWMKSLVTHVSVKEQLESMQLIATGLSLCAFCFWFVMHGNPRGSQTFLFSPKLECHAGCWQSCKMSLFHNFQSDRMTFEQSSGDCETSFLLDFNVKSGRSVLML